MRYKTLTSKITGQEIQVDIIQDQVDLDNNVHELYDGLLRLVDEAENNEPLQAKQSLEILEAKFNELKDYINALPG